MLRGERVVLRARRESDIAVFDTELHDDVETRVRSDSRPWRPVPAGSPASGYRVPDDSKYVACFSVDELSSGELAGEALLWGIDQHNRLAHLGMALRPGFRGRGLSTDTVRVLCRYGFVILGLHRLQLETLADNEAMTKAATSAGFVIEGTLRRNAWVNGEFLDEVILGQLASEWAAR
ncbi:MAG TPA: GNAT family protein [Streptosporangiaceae bacterium]|jgi:RimJ/RimL family protein N-acetyltransferase